MGLMSEEKLDELYTLKKAYCTYAMNTMCTFFFFFS